VFFFFFLQEMLGFYFCKMVVNICIRQTSICFDFWLIWG